MSLLTRNDFLKKDDFKIEKVNLENGDYVFVKEMSAKAKEEYQRSLIDISFDKNGNPQSKEKTNNFYAKLAVCTMCDEEGNLIMQSSDIPKMSEFLKASKLEKIADAAQKLNMMSNKSIEEEVKN